jgi:DNA-directed RNA polymerase subunit RPC12/RpoP
MNEVLSGNYAGRKQTYLDKKGLGHDSILRCSKCQKLVLMDDIKKNGQCHYCGSSKLNELRVMSDVEKQEVEKMDFPYKEEFLGEFTNNEG